MFENQIICGDSEHVLKEFPDSCIDIIVTSPPYNFGMEYDVYKDDIDSNEYFQKITNILFECYRVLKSGGRLCLNLKPMYRQYYPTHHILTYRLLELGFNWKTEIIWDTENYDCPYTCWGSWKSPSQPYLKFTHEYINVYCKETQKKEGNKENIDITPEEFKELTYGFWKIKFDHYNKQFNHPATFPEEIPYRLLKLFSYKGDVVLDPFNGIGTTTFIAKKLDRKCVGIDISENYCNTARKRVEEMINKDLII